MAGVGLLMTSNWLLSAKGELFHTFSNQYIIRTLVVYAEAHRKKALNLWQQRRTALHHFSLPTMYSVLRNNVTMYLSVICFALMPKLRVEILITASHRWLEPLYCRVDSVCVTLTFNYSHHSRLYIMTSVVRYWSSVTESLCVSSPILTKYLSIMTGIAFVAKVLFSVYIPWTLRVLHVLCIEVFLFIWTWKYRSPDNK